MQRHFHWLKTLHSTTQLVLSKKNEAVQISTKRTLFLIWNNLKFASDDRLRHYFSKYDTSLATTMRISPAAVRRIAQDEVIHRVSKSKRVSSERFAAAFGCSPKVAAALWNRLDGKDLLPRDALVKHLLWGLAFLKLYNVERAQAPPSGADEKTFRKWVWIVLDALAELDLVGDRPTASSA